MPRTAAGAAASYRKPCVVRLEGCIDLSTRQHTRAQLAALAGCRYGIVDLREAQIGDATLFGDLAMSRLHAGERAAIVLVISNDRMRRLFRIVHFDKYFSIVATIAEAHRVFELQQAS